MAAWHPLKDLQPIVFHYPKPGTDEPYAIIQWVNVMLEGKPVSRWRCVTLSEPRRLVLAVYYLDLRDAAMDCNRLAVANMVPAVLNEQRR